MNPRSVEELDRLIADNDASRAMEEQILSLVMSVSDSPIVREVHENRLVWIRLEATALKWEREAARLKAELENGE